jgi:3-oxoacyl-[acyl-carrier protein] reductase
MLPGQGQQVRDNRFREGANVIEIDFTGRTVLVTGGSSGIGNGIAHTFRRAGARVLVTGTRPGATDYAGEEGSDLTGLEYQQLDVGDDAAVDAFDPGLDRLDVLVNSVGTVAYKRQEFAMEGWRRVMDVNINGVMHCCTKWHDLIAASDIEGGGSIIIVSSMASFHATRGNPAYSASKGGLRTLTMTLAEAWGRDGIRVNAVAPGFVDTKLTKVTRDNPDLYEGTIRDTPLGRWGTPAEMGGVALFLASPLAAYVTGAMIPVDGGKGLS